MRAIKEEIGIELLVENGRDDDDDESVEMKLESIGKMAGRTNDENPNQTYNRNRNYN